MHSKQHHERSWKRRLCSPHYSFTRIMKCTTHQPAGVPPLSRSWTDHYPRPLLTLSTKKTWKGRASYKSGRGNRKQRAHKRSSLTIYRNTGGAHRAFLAPRHIQKQWSWPRELAAMFRNRISLPRDSLTLEPNLGFTSPRWALPHQSLSMAAMHPSWLDSTHISCISYRYWS